MKKTEEATPKPKTLLIQPPKIQTALFRIRGTAPYVQHRFATKAKEQMKAKQEAGSTAKKGGNRAAKDFMAEYEAAMYKIAAANGKPEGYGIPAPAFRNAMISACRILGFPMTRAKMGVFVEADAFDAADGTPLIRILKGTPHYTEMPVRLETGVIDIRVRPMWDAGWEADVRVRFDADMFTLEDIGHLLLRAGVQVGIGEGRPDSKKSCGMGWGLFDLVESK
jgi:hypothetical protein